MPEGTRKKERKESTASSNLIASRVIWLLKENRLRSCRSNAIILYIQAGPTFILSLFDIYDLFRLYVTSNGGFDPAVVASNSKHSTALNPRLLTTIH